MKPWIALSDLMSGIKKAIESGFSGHTFRILAETTDVKVYHQRQYAFLNLVEKQGDQIAAAAGAVIWRDHFPLIRNFEKATGITFAQNLELVLEVEIQFHERYGLRLSIVDIDTAYTLGKLEQERENVLRKLAAQEPQLLWLEDGDYVSANHLLKRPLVMQRIALISAAGSDGRRDFLQELQNNSWAIRYHITEFNAAVQGTGAAGEIARQLNNIAGHAADFDLIAIVRGGGSNTDFSAFDHYEVAKQICASPKPVWTGIGHDRNISVADVVCNEMLKTPTRCAAAITEHNLGFLGFIQDSRQKIGKSAERFIENGRNDLAEKKRRIQNALKWRIESERSRLLQNDRHLEMLYPAKTLIAGYAMIRKNGKVIRSVSDLNVNDDIQIRLADGVANATITAHD